MKKTCSLACVKIHKQLDKCDGKYNYEKFIKIGDYQERDLRKDLFYLDEMMKSQDRVKKKLSMLNKNKSQLRFKLLRVFAKRKGNINLLFAPFVIKKHRDNLSFYHTKTKQIYWSIEIKFLLKNKKGDN